MIPVPAVLGAVRAYLPLLALIVGGLAVAYGAQQIRVWRASHHALRATETALERSQAELRVCTDSAVVVAQAAREAVLAAAQQAEADRLTAERVSRDLRAQMAAADGRARDLADRLRRYQARRCPDPVPAAADPAGNAADAAGEPAGDAQAGASAVDAAHAALLTACASDATRLASWIDWWREVSARATR